MSFRSGRPIQRYVLVLCVLLFFVFYSGHHLNLNAKQKDLNQPDIQLDYVKPNGEEVKQDTFLEIDRDLIRQRERQAMRRQIDRKYCGRDQCRFMLPIAITEQGKLFSLYLGDGIHSNAFFL